MGQKNILASDEHSAPLADSMGCLATAAVALILTFIIVLPRVLCAEVVPVRHREGLVHGFLVLSTIEGEALAHGDLIQVARGNRVSLHLRFDFKDGSVYDESTIYSERSSFRLLSYHLVQKGPSFPHPIEVSVDCSTGQVTGRSTGDDGTEKTVTDHLDLPLDVSNGIVLTLLKNILPASPRTTLSFLAAAPKPRLVKLVISALGEESFSVGGPARKATHYVVKVEIGGVAGLVAPLIGKQPADTHVWIVGGEAPAFLKSQGPLFAGGPIWRIELASPVWPKAVSPDKELKPR